MIEAAVDYCKKLTERSKSSFYYAFLFLPREKREALEAVYAFCRLVDDVVDEDAPADAKREGVARWRAELERIYGDEAPQHPVALRLKETLRRFPIRRDDLAAIIDGCEMDIDKTRYRDWEELEGYCYRVASAVGLACIEIFGYTNPKTREYAIDLGIALQLTNILRDVAEDARRGRIYLPASELQAFGVSDKDVLSGRPSAALKQVLRAGAKRARLHYCRARAAIGDAEKRELVVAEIMGDIYYALLEQIEAREFDVFGDKATVRRRDKMRIALGNFARAQLHQLIARA